MEGLRKMLDWKNIAMYTLSKQASKQASKPLFTIKACFFPSLGIFSVIFSACLVIILPRNPLSDYRGIFCLCIP